MVQPPRVGHLPPRLPRSQIPDLAVPSLPWISKMSARSHTTLPLSLPQAPPRVTKGTTGNPKTPLVLVMDPAIAGRTLSPPCPVLRRPLLVWPSQNTCVLPLATSWPEDPGHEHLSDPQTPWCIFQRLLQ